MSEEVSGRVSYLSVRRVTASDKLSERDCDVKVVLGVVPELEPMVLSLALIAQRQHHCGHVAQIVAEVFHKNVSEDREFVGVNIAHDDILWVLTCS